MKFENTQKYHFKLSFKFVIIWRKKKAISKFANILVSSIGSNFIIHIYIYIYIYILLLFLFLSLAFSLIQGKKYFGRPEKKHPDLTPKEKYKLLCYTFLMETIQKIRVIWIPKILLMDSNPLNHHFKRLPLQQSQLQNSLYATKNKSHNPLKRLWIELYLRNKIEFYFYLDLTWLISWTWEKETFFFFLFLLFLFCFSSASFPLPFKVHK